MHLDRVTPIQRIFDDAKAREFYRDFFGFAFDWEHRFEPGLPLYLQITRGAVCCTCPNTTGVPVLVLLRP